MCTQHDVPSCEEYCHYCLLSPIKHRHAKRDTPTHTLKTVLKVQSTTERVVAWLRSTGVFKSLMDTYFGQFERFPPVLFAHRQSVTFLKTNTQQINISNFVPAKISLTSEIMT